LIALVTMGSAALAAPRHKKKTTPPPTTDKDKDKDKDKDAGSGSSAGSATEAVTAPDPGTTTPTTGAGSGSGSTSAVADQNTQTKDSAEKEPDVDSLRQEYLSLRDELFKSRARANAVASQLYSTRITIKFTWASARYYGVSKASVRLDGATVYEDAGGAIAGDDGVRFDGYVAPGRHLITFHVEASGKDDDSFTSSTESQVVVKAVAQKDLVVAAKGHDSGDIAYEWKRSEHGSYGLGIDVSVKTAKPVAGDVAAPTKGKK
jgi:3-hydroxymyristoyl/3-hydroxydecanoyl-(acyl carrier protein) dehydratase